MTDQIEFKLDGKAVAAAAGETIWDVAKREGTEIPHLCHVDLPGYRADGNCRACMVEVKGERVLAASCIRKPAAGMEVETDTERAVKSREMVFELLASNMRPRDEGPDNQSPFWQWASSMGIAGSDRYRSKFDGEHGHPAEIRHLESRHRREPRRLHRLRRLRARLPRGAGQRRDRHGALRGGHASPGVRHPRSDGPLDLRDLRRVRAGLPDGRALREVADGRVGNEARGAEIRQSRRYAVPVLRRRAARPGSPSRTTRIVQVDGRNGFANENRLCVKGRFGFDYAMSPERLTKPLIRRDDAPKNVDCRPARRRSA